MKLKLLWNIFKSKNAGKFLGIDCICNCHCPKFKTALCKYCKEDKHCKTPRLVKIFKFIMGMEI